MAHRLFIHRLWNVTMKEIHCLAASTATSSYKNGIFFISASNSITHVSHRRSSFNVQDKDDFTERVINNKLPVLIDFHAQWCGPCKILGPRLEKAVAKQIGNVAMAKVDIDDHTDLAIEYGVSAVPTVIGMKGGNVIGQFVGLKDDDELDSFVSHIIGQ